VAASNDAWNNPLAMLDAKTVCLLSVQQKKIAFEVTPLNLYLTRFAGEDLAENPQPSGVRMGMN